MVDQNSSREEVPPFLARTFVKIGSFHRLDLFEDGHLPTTDEHQLFLWKDTTLREILTTLRITAPNVAEYRHPLARFSFKVAYADPQNRGRFTSKELGMVYSRDVLGEPGSVGVTAPRLLEEPQLPGRSSEGMDVVQDAPAKGRDDNKTLDDLRFVAGDFLLIAVLLPKSATAPSEIAIKGSAPAPAWKSGVKADSGWGGGLGNASAPSGGFGRGGGHWRGGPDSGLPGRGRGAGRGAASDRDRDRDRDRVDRERDYRRPPSGREAGRGGRGKRPSPSRSRSYSPARSRSRSRSPRRRRYRD